MNRSPKLSAAQAAVVKRALVLGYIQSRIAAVFGVNQGRVSEIRTGKAHAGVIPAIALPAGFPAL